MRLKKVGQNQGRNLSDNWGGGGPTPLILKSSRESLGKSKCIQTNVHHMGKLITLLYH